MPTVDPSADGAGDSDGPATSAPLTRRLVRHHNISLEASLAGGLDGVARHDLAIPSRLGQ
jgi:hypothetical protein